MEHDFYSVRIIRRIDQAAVAIYLKEFFMFCGIYVQEYISDEQAGEMDFQLTDLNLYLTEYGEEREKLKAFCEYNITEQKNKLLKDEWDSVLEQTIKKVDHSVNGKGMLKEVFDKLINVFITYDYAYLNYERHCFLQQMNSDEKLEMAQKYYDCYEALRSYDKCGKEYVYLKFARFNCARKVNDVCRARGDRPYFKADKIMKEAAGISRFDSNFSMAFVLAGLIGLSHDTLWLDGEFYLKKALNMEQGKLHSTFILYALGHFLEFSRNSFGRAWEQYEEILKIAPENYRALFKCGCKMLREQNGEEAFNQFEKICNLIRNKKDWEKILPLEIEYFYKCRRIILEIAIVNRYSNETQAYMKSEMENLKESALKNSQFAQDFWGKEKVEKYSEKLKNKLENYQFLHL